MIIIVIIIAVSEVSSDTIFDNSWTKCAPTDGKNPVPANIDGSENSVG